MLNEGNVMRVLYMAKKYILPSLADECIDFLKRNLDPTNVCLVLSQARRYDEKSLECCCWEMIDKRTNDVLKSEGFATIERSFLEEMIERNTLTVSEVELFQAIDLWAIKECERQELAAIGNVKRMVLGEEIVKGIRFPTMEQKEFVSVVLDSDVLTRKEVYDLMKNFNGVLTEPSVGFQEYRRIGTYQPCCRFGDFCASDEEEGWDYQSVDKTHDSIKFSVDKEVMLHGIRLFGSKCNIYSVFLEIFDPENAAETFLNLKRECFLSVPLPFKKKEIYIFDIFFDPFSLRKSKEYVVCASIGGPSSCYGCCGSGSIKCHDVTFYFEDYNKEAKVDSTSVYCGQFAEFFFRPL